MTYEDLLVLIPCHSLEDFPTELGEDEAAGLLNAFAVAWHPELLASAGMIPSWHRSDELPEVLENRLIIVPSCCDDWLSSGWTESATSAGAVVVQGLHEREALIRAAVTPIRHEDSSRVDPHLVADFLALGTCNLQVELLTRHMHHFGDRDEVFLQREAVAAAQAAVAGDEETTRKHLQACFDALIESRERFYPVDCYLVDLCLLIPELADQHLDNLLSNSQAVNFLISADDLEQIARDKPELITKLKDKWETGAAEVVGGEWKEGPSPILPVQSLLWQFDQGHKALKLLLGRVPTTWGRRRFGLNPLMPQILDRYGYRAALHIVLDDGIYPDAEQSKIRWEGCDGSAVDAVTRIPLAADGASSFLRFPERMAESMQQDQVAMVNFARWPEIKAPWLDDFRRMNRYAPVLGRFVTLDDFVEQSDSAGWQTTYEAGEYLSPFLLQSVAREEPDPLSRYTDHFQARHLYESGRWCRCMADLLSPEVGKKSSDVEAERSLEEAGPDGTAEDRRNALAIVQQFADEAAHDFAKSIMTDAGGMPGFLLGNSLSFPRRVSVDLPALESPPETDEAVKAVQFDGVRRTITVQLPACGFAWIPSYTSSPAASPDAGALLADDGVLRNEFFEVHLNDVTGGISEIKEYGRRPNRLSQQLGFRFPREQTIQRGEGDEAEVIKTYYSEMRGLSMEVTCDGPALGEIVTTGELIDLSRESRVAGFRQTVRIWRGRRVVEIDIELDVDHMPEENPWTNYIACRFAWNDSTASLTRSLLHGAQTFQGERFESPYYLEIAEGEQRTTILNHGLPFHRKTGPRMVDSLLVTAGETRRQFRFTIAVDENYPMHASLSALTPVTVVPTTSGPPRVGRSGWFFHLSAKNVQILSIRSAANQSTNSEETEIGTAVEPSSNPAGVVLRLIETEGRTKQIGLSCFRSPTSAQKCNFQGDMIADLAINDDTVQIDVTAYEIADIVIRFS